MFSTRQKAIPKFESPKVSKPDGYQAAAFWDVTNDLIFPTHLLQISRQVINLQYTQNWCTACLQHKAHMNSTSVDVISSLSVKVKTLSECLDKHLTIFSQVLSHFPLYSYSSVLFFFLFSSMLGTLQILRVC